MPGSGSGPGGDLVFSFDEREEIADQISEWIRDGFTADEIAQRIQRESGFTFRISVFNPGDPVYQLNDTLNRRVLRNRNGDPVLVHLWPHTPMSAYREIKLPSSTTRGATAKPRKSGSGNGKAERPTESVGSVKSAPAKKSPTRKRGQTQVPPRKRARRSATRRTRRPSKK